MKIENEIQRIVENEQRRSSKILEKAGYTAKVENFGRYSKRLKKVFTEGI